MSIAICNGLNFARYSIGNTKKDMHTHTHILMNSTRVIRTKKLLCLRLVKALRPNMISLDNDWLHVDVDVVDVNDDGD